MLNTRTRLIAPLLAGAVVLGMGTIAVARTGADDSGLTRSLGAELNQYLADHGTAEHLSAVSLRVDFPGDRADIDTTVGTAQYGGTTPVPRHSEWQIASNTKAFTAVVLLRLEAEGKLSIHDTVGKWLPQYPAWRDITVQRLLDMTSGIPDYVNQDAFLGTVATAPDTVFTADRLVSYVTDLPLGPSGYAYSNTNYILAEMIIERAGHDTFAHQLAQRVITPLGLHDTCYAPDTCPAGTAARMATGYFAAASVPALFGTPVPALDLTWARTAGGIVASLADLTTWDRALYTGRLLPARQQQELQSLVSSTTGKPILRTIPTDPTGYGLGVQQRTTTSAGTVWIYEGQNLGYRTLHVYDPRTGVIVAVAVNSAVDTGTVDGRDPLGDLAIQALRTVAP